MRWAHNFTLSLISSLLTYAIFPLSTILLAAEVEAHNFGLLNHLSLPQALKFILGLILLDLAIYGQHWLFHHWPLLWRIHRVHHCDPHLDTSTALRFHPLEILLSMGWKLVLIVAIGPSPQAVATFEILLNGNALFHHGNIQLPPKWEDGLGRIIITPAIHALHHSQLKGETNSNYGFFLSLWDRLFGTYTHPTPERQPPIGLAEFLPPLTLSQLLWIPCSHKTGGAQHHRNH